MKSPLITAAMTACVCLFATAHADEKDTLNAYDVKFMKSAGQSSLNETKLAELGSQKAFNQEVKMLAATLVNDHTAILAEAKQLAEKKGISLSASIDEKTADTFKELEKKSGEDFDTAFVKHMDDGHIKSIKSYEEAQKEVKDVDVKAWVDKTVVIIKKHHEKIKKLK